MHQRASPRRGSGPPLRALESPSWAARRLSSRSDRLARARLVSPAARAQRHPARPNPPVNRDRVPIRFFAGPMAKGAIVSGPQAIAISRGTPPVPPDEGYARKSLPGCLRETVRAPVTDASDRFRGTNQSPSASASDRGHIPSPTTVRIPSTELYLPICSDHFFIYLSALTTFAPELSKFIGQN
jgi:hypothetical protein